MEYLISFRSGQEVKLVLEALNELPHKVSRGTIDHITKQAQAIESEAQNKAVEALIKEKTKDVDGVKSSEEPPIFQEGEQEESTIEEVKEGTDS